MAVLRADKPALLDKVNAVISGLQEFISSGDLRSYDPYDALNSDALLTVARLSRVGGVAVTQAFRFSPINLRPLFRVKALVNAKSVALLVRSHAQLYATGGRAGDLRVCIDGLEWLAQHQSGYSKDASWGYSFPWSSRRHVLERGAPTTVCSSFVAHAFLDGFEATGNHSYLEIARSTCEFILACPRSIRESSYCFSYSPFNELAVHNANLLAVSVLGRVYRLSGERRLVEAAVPALKYTLEDQNRDGSWYYDGGPNRRDNTVDNFHTGFLLECIRQFAADAGCDLDEPLRRGQEFYEARFFDSDGRPRRKLSAQYPIDIRDCAQLMVVIGRIPDPSRVQIDLLSRVVSWTIGHMLSRRGYAYFQRWKHWSYTPYYLRWQAWLLWGLANSRRHLTESAIHP